MGLLEEAKNIEPDLCQSRGEISMTAKAEKPGEMSSISGVNQNLFLKKQIVYYIAVCVSTEKSHNLVHR